MGTSLVERRREHHLLKDDGGTSRETVMTCKDNSSTDCHMMVRFFVSGTDWGLKGAWLPSYQCLIAVQLRPDKQAIRPLFKWDYTVLIP